MMSFTNEICYVCHNTLSEEVNWARLLTRTRKSYICSDCDEQFIKITEAGCKICSRPLNNDKYDDLNSLFCYDCVRWDENLEWSGVLERNYSLFLYDEFLKDLIAKYKYRGDYALCNVFRNQLIAKLSELQFDIVVPIPLSAERLYERGFNQVTALLDCAEIEYRELLRRAHSEKQAKKTRQERLNNEQIFTILSKYDITDKVVLLVDDIYTTGITLRLAAKLLKQNGAKSVKAITIARS